jgi:hypothetical protein
MEPRLTKGSHRVDAVRGCAAIERGPLVYCIEQADRIAGVLVDDVVLERGGMTCQERPDLLGGVTTVEVPGAGALWEPGAAPYYRDGCGCPSPDAVNGPKRGRNGRSKR